MGLTIEGLVGGERLDRLREKHNPGNIPFLFLSGRTKPRSHPGPFQYNALCGQLDNAVPNRYDDRDPGPTRVAF